MHKQCRMNDLPHLMLGTSPFIGAGQFGSRSSEYRKRFFDNPDNMTELLSIQPAWELASSFLFREMRDGACTLAQDHRNLPEDSYDFLPIYSQ